MPWEGHLQYHAIIRVQCIVCTVYNYIGKHSCGTLLLVLAVEMQRHSDSKRRTIISAVVTHYEKRTKPTKHYVGYTVFALKRN